jgi:ABC-2 type transport system permease protein
MTTVTAARAPAPSGRTTRGGALVGTPTLIRFNLRRDRIRLPVWLAILWLVQVTGPGTYTQQFPTAADRANNAAVMTDNPALKVMTGPGHGLDNYTYGAMMSNEYLGFMLIFVALMSVLMVVRHTRAEEETGRAELVRSSVVGRRAHLAAALATVATANVALGLLIAVGMVGTGVESIDWPGSLVFGAAYTVVGLVFAGVAAITAQISEYSRAASGMAGALIGAAYGLRGIGDAGAGALSWASPIGWAQASAPYVDNTWWPLGLALAVAVALVVAAFVISGRRDVGAGLRPERRGTATASPLLGTPQGFAWRLQRSGVIWWSIAMFVGGLSYGSPMSAIEDYQDNEFIQQFAESVGGATLTESFLSISMAVLAIICTVFAIIAGLRPRREETSGRAESILTTSLSRTRWVTTHLVVATLGGAGLLLVSGVGLGVGAAASTGDAGYIGQSIGTMLTYAPALWLTAGLAVTVFGLMPKAIGLAWAVLAYAIFVAYFGGLLDLPGWMLDLSPFTHIPRMPADDFTTLPLLILTMIATGLIAAGLTGFRRRDIELK